MTSNLEERVEANRQTAEFDFQVLLIEVADQIVRRMAEMDLNRVQLAERLGVSAARVSQVLSGDQNLTLRSLVGIAKAMDSRIMLSLASRPRVRVHIWEPPRSLFLVAAGDADFALAA